jgi:hypothetical protein
MGAGVATNPHCPSSMLQAPKSFRSVAGRFESQLPHCCFGILPFALPSLALRSRWTAFEKVGSAFASRFFPLLPCPAVLAFILADAGLSRGAVA